MKNEEVPTSQFHILSRWYYLSLLDLCTCKEFTDDPEWIAKRLGITPFEAKRAWQMLLQGRWVKRTETGWTKSNKHLRFPTRQSQEVVRNYHRQTLEKAQKELNKTDPESFAKRLISGASVAVNPEKIEEAKLRLHAALVEISKLLSEGPCTEVYQLQVQLFPVTREVK